MHVKGLKHAQFISTITSKSDESDAHRRDMSKTFCDFTHANIDTVNDFPDDTYYILSKSLSSTSIRQTDSL